uniref:Uncharacterized protein n=1 Tax=Avena sativa TaxID=4498 RepID=A0ACD5T899_AVESA
MGSTRRRSTSNGSKSEATPSAWTFLAVLLLILLSCSPCQGRKLLAADHEQGKVMHFEGGLVLRVPSSSRGEEAATAAAAAAPRGFSRAERSMRSVPSPGVGH